MVRRAEVCNWFTLFDPLFSHFVGNAMPSLWTSSGARPWTDADQTSRLFDLALSPECVT